MNSKHYKNYLAKKRPYFNKKCTKVSLKKILRFITLRNYEFKYMAVY